MNCKRITLEGQPYTVVKDFANTRSGKCQCALMAQTKGLKRTLLSGRWLLLEPDKAVPTGHTAR